MTKIEAGELWRRRPAEAAAFETGFVQEHGVLLGKFLASRGFRDAEGVNKFLNPRLSHLPLPSTLKNLDAAAEKIAEIIRANRPLLVYGDYDVDGMSGLTLAADFFKKIGFDNYKCYQPHRFDEGYGVHASSLAKIHESFPFEAVLTVDSGISAIDAAQWLRDRAIPFVITDHHLPPSQLPDTPFIVNPNQPGCGSGLGILCGTAVLFFLLAGVKGALKKDIKLDEFLDLVALATIADQMELRDANRSLVREGLKRWPAKVRPGLQLLTSAITKELDARDIAFTVAPKLNAASRMGQVERALALLQAATIEEAHLALVEVEKLNENRVASQAKVLSSAREQALAQVDAGRSLLIVQGEEWAEGVLGIVAAKLADEYFLPAIVLSKTPQGSLRGSMRSRAGFHCLSFLEGAREFLVRFGGHAEAAGLELAIDKLATFEAYIHSIDFSPADGERVVEYDGDLTDFPTLADVETLALSGPWGRGNPDPLFCMPKLRLSGRRVMKERHVKWDFRSGSVIGFGFEAICQALEAAGHQDIDVLVVPEISEFRNRRSVQLRITKVRGA